MSEEKRKWEEEYDKWNEGAYDDRYEELTAIYEREAISKEEAEVRFSEPQTYEDDEKKRTEKAEKSKSGYAEYKKMKAIKTNLSKVKNILELRDKLISEKEAIEKEMQRRKQARKLNKEKDKLEKENADLLSELNEINSKLKDKDLSAAERKNLEKQKQENLEKRNKNNENFKENQEKMKDSIPEKQSDLSQKSDEELKKETISLSTKISKCNMACNNLMQGKSWDAVEVKLDNWKEKSYTGQKGQVAEKAEATNSYGEEEKADIEREDEEAPEQVDEEELEEGEYEYDEEELEEDELEEDEYEHDEENESNLPAEYKTFAERHPRLAKIPFVARIADRIDKRRLEKAKEKEEILVDEALEDLGEKIVAIMDEEYKEQNGNEEHQENKGHKENDFKKYLREVAEKGLDGIEKENQASARERLTQKTQEAAKGYAEKYGGRYNEQDGADLEEDER